MERRFRHPLLAALTAALLAMLPACGAQTTDADVDTGAVSGTGDTTDTAGTAAPDEARGATPAAEPEPEPVEPTHTATAQVEEIVVLDEPDGAETHRFEHPNHNGVPLTFMVIQEQHGWLQVQLPVRPNGSTGWIRAADVDVTAVPYAIEVSVADKELVLLRNGHEMHRFPVATGTGDTPTPTGTYYLTELLEPLNEGYGAYAYGLSAFSDVINDFGGGPGQIGLHGTEDESSIGQAASHGCIRMTDPDITTLVQLLPLGTPITIT